MIQMESVHIENFPIEWDLNGLLVRKVIWIHILIHLNSDIYNSNPVLSCEVYVLKIPSL